MCGVQNVLARDGFKFLREIANTEPRPLPDGAFVRRFFFEDHAEERGLAGAIGSHQADARAGAEMRRGTFKQNPCGILFID